MENIKNINPSDFEKAIAATENSFVLDVRTADEAGDGVIENATLINFFDSSFASEVEKLDKNKSYFVYCRSGNRSMKACNIMYDLGIKDLTNLNGGMMAWNANNMKTTNLK